MRDPYDPDDEPVEAPPSPLERAFRRLVRGGYRTALRARNGAGHLLGASPGERPPLVERRSHSLGLPAGTPSAMPGREGAPPVHLSVLRYGPGGLEEFADVTARDACALSDHAGVTWVNLDGVHDPEAVRQLGEAFHLHPLVQEDLTHTTQRPKMEVYGDHVFVVLKMVTPSAGPAEQAYARGQAGHQVEQVGFWLGPRYLLTFMEDPGDVFDTVRARLRSGGGSIRQQGPDYLLYALLDVVVDHYFATLERLGDVTEQLEDEVFDRPSPDILRTINRLRRQTMRLRRAIWPLREVLAGLLREETPLVTDRTRLYLRDVYDHLIQAVDAVENVRDVLDQLVEHYLSAVSFRTNEIMRKLTVVSTVFLPLTFIAGVYGMNFEHMPELTWRYGYFGVVVVMLAVAVGILAYFGWKGYLGDNAPQQRPRR